MTGIFYAMLFGMIFGAVFGGIFGYFMKCKATGSRIKSGMTKGESGDEACPGTMPSSKKKQANLEKVMDLLNTKSKITNDDVERALKVSDATAERYLNELEKSGKLKQQSKGKGTYYTK